MTPLRHYRHKVGYQWLEHTFYLHLRSVLWAVVPGGDLSNKRHAQLLSACSAATLAVMKIDARALYCEVEALLS